MSVSMDMKILVVDDYKTMLKIVSNLLKQVGFRHIDTASDGGEAFTKLQRGEYGLVISDWNMQPVTGLDLLRKVRADKKLATTPFIMVTAESKSENVVTAKQSGVNNYIVKPFTAQVLKQKLVSVLGAF